MTSEATSTDKKGFGQGHLQLPHEPPRPRITLLTTSQPPPLPPAIITAPSTPTPSPALSSITTVTPPPASPTTTDSGATLVPTPTTPTATKLSSVSSSASKSKSTSSKSERHQQQEQQQPKKRRRPRLDLLSRSTDILFLIFQHLREGHDQTKTPSSQSAYEFTTIHRPHSTATCTTVKAITESRIHDLVQDAFSKIIRVNRAFAKVGLPFLWERPKIRTCRQLDRFAYTLQHHGWQYFDYIKELVVRQGSIPDANNESLWWGHARCRAILFKIATECTQLGYLDCNWAGSPFDQTMVRSLTETSFIALKVLRLEPLKMPSKEQTLSEDNFNRLITCCPNLESLELEEGYKVSNRSVIHLLMICQNLAHFSFPTTCVSGWVDAIDMGFGENLRSIKIYTPDNKDGSNSGNNNAGRDIHLDSYSFRPHCLQKLESVHLDIGGGDFVNALFSKPKLPALRALRILHPSNQLLKILSERLAPQLTMFETKLNDQTDQEIYKIFSRKMTSLQSLDCSPGPVMGLIGRNITTLSANSSLRLLDSIAELCPKLEDLTLWGGSISRDPSRQRYPRSDPQSGMIYVIEMCPIKRLRLVNAYLGFGPQFWQACGEFGTHLEILDIELFDCKGLSSWGMFEGLRHCRKLQWLRLTELLGVQKQVMMSCLKDLTRLCALHISIPDMETGSFSMSMDEIASFLSSFCELSEVNLIVPKPCPNSATTTPRSSMDLSNQRQFCYGLPYARADPTMVFKNALNQNIYGRVEWSVPGIGYY